ncbi:MAG: hypothetical protein GY811_20850 [Myxococcales bacterium]|nr:hypothetical protein [Myxococcales bacterium]
MFLSKIWFFLITIVAGVAITIALIMPRPAERAAKVQEDDRVRTACLVTGVLLRDNARARIQLTSEFAQAVRQLKLSRTLFEASKDEIISGQANATGRKELTTLLESVSGTKPSLVWLLDRRGRVVARSNLDDTTYGDSVRGYYAVQDALDGYVRDDLWMMDDGLYRVAAAPVLTQSLEWAGAVVLGQAMDQEFALSLSENISANINFYVSGEAVAASEPIQIHKDVVAGSKELADLDEGQGCSSGTLLHVKAGGKRYAVVNAALPGEAGEQQAFYSVFIERAKPLDFMGMLKSAKKDDLGFDRFPWIKVIGVFIIMMVVGLGLTLREVDGPLKKLNKNAVALAQGEAERFDEMTHRAKYGSIARSVNIAIDKMHRDAKAAKKDLDQLLGPAPDGAVPRAAGAVDAGASALPPIGPGGSSGAAATPPPSEFKFGGAAAPPSGGLGLPSMEPTTPAPAMPGLAQAQKKKPVGTPPPPPEKTPPPVPVRPKTAGGIADIELQKPTDTHKIPDAIDADILGDDAPTVADDGAQPANYFEQVYGEFIALKKICGEPTENLSFERFAKKLRKNEDTLIAKHDCKSVKFQVYEKDGKAALKASPVK